MSKLTLVVCFECLWVFCFFVGEDGVEVAIDVGSAAAGAGDGIVDVVAVVSDIVLKEVVFFLRR